MLRGFHASAEKVPALGREELSAYACCWQPSLQGGDVGHRAAVLHPAPTKSCEADTDARDSEIGILKKPNPGVVYEVMETPCL